ncbi:BatD family protein [Rhizosphaericola mali]|uniref:Protein BatD n=1 Tax=Rhizosphaericola mali TaxID=2545455 RepID=A0A5P2G9N1_9BACT|nr:BatD family protein [Rhizosphaericola mali]QES90652.1 protein BatD [Rhizosphaericola mali]
MKQRISIISILLLCCVVSTSLFAQIKFTTEISANVIGKEDYLQVQYSVSGNSDQLGDIQVAGFPGWQVVSGPQTSQQTSIVNGTVSASFSNVYLLKPQHTGKLVVPGAKVELNGSTYSSGAKAVLVKDVASLGNNTLPNNSSAGGMSGSLKALMDQMAKDDQDMDAPNGNVLHPGQTPEDLIKGNIFIRVLPSKKKVYVGEPFYVDYQLVTSLALQARPSKQPVFKGVSVVDFTKQTSATTITIGNRKYHAFLIRRVQLTALEVGKIDLGIAETSNDIPYSTYDDPYHTNTKTVAVHNEPSFVDAVELPAAGRPTNFSGAIGQFDMKTTVQNIQSPVGENNMLFVTLNGTGNLNGVHKFSIDWSKNIDHYDGTDSQGLDKSNVPFLTTKEFKIPFIGNKVGDASIPSFDFNYFDPNSGTYKVLKSDEINLHFTTALAKPVSSINVIAALKDYIPYVIIGLLIIIFLILLIKGRKKMVVQKQKKEEEEKPIVLPTKEEKPKPQIGQPMMTEPIVAPVESEEIKINFEEKLQEIMLLQEKNEVYQKSKELVVAILQKVVGSKATDTNVLQMQLEHSNHMQKQGILDIVSSINGKINKGLYSPFFTESDKINLLDDLNILLRRAELN